MRNGTLYLAAFFSAIAAGAADNAAAMALSARGLGKVLEFPYYTVNGDQ